MPTSVPSQGFQHDALLYGSDETFVEGVGSFIRDGVDAGEPVLVAVGAHKIDMLRRHLGKAARRVDFIDMSVLGSNPARMLSAWDQFTTDRGGSGHRVRGVGEPVWPERSAAELLECEIHEQLLNIAFAGGEGWSLLCPYDTSALSADAIEMAHRTHPFLEHGAQRSESDRYLGHADSDVLFERALPAPPDTHTGLTFGAADLGRVRRFVASLAYQLGLDELRTSDAVLAVHELAANSVVHGGGLGEIRAWFDDDTLVCEVSDAGHIDSPLAGRRRPSQHAVNGRGLWMVMQLCDLVQVRTAAHGSSIRIHIRRSS